jgi:hypothetical protein
MSDLAIFDRPHSTPATGRTRVKLTSEENLRGRSSRLNNYSHAVPRNVLEPALETMLTWLPAVWPYSAVKKRRRLTSGAAGCYGCRAFADDPHRAGEPLVAGLFGGRSRRPRHGGADATLDLAVGVR